MPTTPRRVVVVGATGNVGLSVVRRLADRGDVEVVGVARRAPDLTLPNVTWQEADLTPRHRGDDEPGPLEGLLAGADAVVHLAWLIQPSRDRSRLWEVNVGGTHRLLEAVRRAEVPHLLYASSVGAYAPAAPGTVVDESWPTQGVGTSAYGTAKAYVERALDAFEATTEVQVTRLRPGLIVQRDAASHVRQLFLGSLAPNAAARWLRRAPVLPHVRDLWLPLVHTSDVAAGFEAAFERGAAGAFNLVADPPLQLHDVAALLGARTVNVPPRAVRPLVRAGYAARLHPIDVGWFDLALRTPLLDVGRARAELGWSPRWSSEDALLDVLGGLGDGAGRSTPPLRPDAARDRWREAASGQGARERLERAPRR
ncbi:NAD-dependent epimerase/dehydratase family protein [Nitriliruptoraceae bacterium ZYF776]|nr:NAD-dependent epimerase/dehydratase family protein [Profundirhabdus halotolerans]